MEPLNLPSEAIVYNSSINYILYLHSSLAPFNDADGITGTNGAFSLMAMQCISAGANGAAMQWYLLLAPMAMQWCLLLALMAMTLIFSDYPAIYHFDHYFVNSL